MTRKTHTLDTENDTGPAHARTVCGREAYTVDAAAFGEKPTCKTCQRTAKSRGLFHVRVSDPEDGTRL